MPFLCVSKNHHSEGTGTRYKEPSFGRNWYDDFLQEINSEQIIVRIGVDSTGGVLNFKDYDWNLKERLPRTKELCAYAKGVSLNMKDIFANWANKNKFFFSVSFGGQENQGRRPSIILGIMKGKELDLRSQRDEAVNCVRKALGTLKKYRLLFREISGRPDIIQRLEKLSAKVRKC